MKGYSILDPEGGGQNGNKNKNATWSWQNKMYRGGIRGLLQPVPPEDFKWNSPKLTTKAKTEKWHFQNEEDQPCRKYISFY